MAPLPWLPHQLDRWLRSLLAKPLVVPAPQEELLAVPGKSGFAAVCLSYDRQDVVSDTFHDLESHMGFLLVLVP